MKPEDFKAWLTGFAELHGEIPTTEQWEVIKEHLGLVFNKVTTKQSNPQTGGVVFGNTLRVRNLFDHDNFEEVGSITC